MKRFLIVVVHRNGAALLRETVTAALAAMRDDDHLVVVDNGSTDDSLIVLAREFPTVTVIANGCNAGYARACNQGLNTMPSDYVLFLNNDAQLPPNALDRFAEDFVRDPALALIGAQLVAPDGSLQRSFAPAPTWHSELGLRRRKRVTPTPDTNGLLPVETIVGACIAARRTAIDAVGPMDPDFFFYFKKRNGASACAVTAGKSRSIPLYPSRTAKAIRRKRCALRPKSRRFVRASSTIAKPCPRSWPPPSRSIEWCASCSTPWDN
ncbi:MAG: glycosyltransferase [Cupriavidus sp.]|nr:glycosyltransferase [Cupriavidus sp.]